LTSSKQVERCGGPAPGRCTPQPVRSVSLLDSKDRAVTTQFGGRDHTFTSFSFTAPVPGRYTLKTTVDGQPVKRAVVLRAGHITRANLVSQIK
jgi:hypothetical protein